MKTLREYIDLVEGAEGINLKTIHDNLDAITYSGDGYARRDAKQALEQIAATQNIAEKAKIAKSAFTQISYSHDEFARKHAETALKMFPTQQVEEDAAEDVAQIAKEIRK